MPDIRRVPAWHVIAHLLQIASGIFIMVLDAEHAIYRLQQRTLRRATTEVVSHERITASIFDSFKRSQEPVSYTHLTLPTILLV